MQETTNKESVNALDVFSIVRELFKDLFGYPDNMDEGKWASFNIAMKFKFFQEWILEVSIYEINSRSQNSATQAEFEKEVESLANKYPTLLKYILFLSFHAKDPNEAKGLFDAGKEYQLRLSIQENIDKLNGIVESFYEDLMKRHPEIFITDRNGKYSPILPQKEKPACSPEQEESDNSYELPPTLSHSRGANIR